jgi:hypothetical protein
MPDKKPKKEDKKKPAAKKPAPRIAEKPVEGKAPAGQKKKK